MKSKNMKQKDFVWDYEKCGDPEMHGVYDLLEKKWWLFTKKDGQVKETISKTREELEGKLADRELHMAKKRYHHMLIKWPFTGKTVVNHYEYLVY